MEIVTLYHRNSLIESLGIIVTTPSQTLKDLRNDIIIYFDGIIPTSFQFISRTTKQPINQEEEEHETATAILRQGNSKYKYIMLDFTLPTCPNCSRHGIVPYGGDIVLSIDESALFVKYEAHRSGRKFWSEYLKKEFRFHEKYKIANNKICICCSKILTIRDALELIKAHHVEQITFANSNKQLQ